MCWVGIGMISLSPCNSSLIKRCWAALIVIGCAGEDRREGREWRIGMAPVES